MKIKPDKSNPDNVKTRYVISGRCLGYVFEGELHPSPSGLQVDLIDVVHPELPVKDIMIKRSTSLYEGAIFNLVKNRKGVWYLNIITGDDQEFAEDDGGL